MATTEQDEALMKGNEPVERTAPATPRALPESLPVRPARAAADDEPLVLPPGAHADHLKEDEPIKGHGLKGWLRTFQIARVLGMLALYLYLDGYDVRANFYRRMTERRREEARARGPVALFQEWSRAVDRRAYDRVVRIVRRL